MGRVNTRPTSCNLCGGFVIYTTNDKIYGKKYGSGYCYLCNKCGAYVGTHKPRPKEALGLLSNAEMRKMKMYCHELFDSKWRGKKKGSKIRCNLYKKLAEAMGIDINECHFGYFDMNELQKACNIISGWED